MQSIIGILGGMGPEATVDAMHKLIVNTSASKDQEHIPVITISIPDIPDRSSSILQHQTSPLPKMVEYLKVLENAGAECIIVACNTAHYWFNELKQQSHVDMISIIDAACDALKENHIQKVGLLATSATVRAAMYQSGLAAQQIECIVPESQQQVMDAIYAYKAGHLDEARALMLPVKEALFDQGVERIILGCTEIPLILAAELQAFPERFMDSTNELVCRAIRWYERQTQRKVLNPRQLH